MGQTSRRKGRRWENAVVAWLNDNGFPSAQRNEYVNAQAGDILGLPSWSLECKSGQRLDLAAWVDQARIQAVTADCPYYAVIAKRKGVTDPGGAYVVHTLDNFARWLRE